MKTKAVRRPSARRRQRRQRERAALAVVVGAQQDQHVFERDGDDQRPHDQRQHAEHDVTGDRLVAAGRDRRLAEGVERAGADIAVDDADAAERQREKAGGRASWPSCGGLAGGRRLVYAVVIGD